MRGVLLLCVAMVGCGDPTITDPCPGKITCPGGACCPDGYTYLCGDQCYQSPCGPAQVTCINVDLTDGCYGGVWTGTFSGPGGNLQFTINEHVISATAPGNGTGSIDCDTGLGTWMTTSGTSSYKFTGTFRHTETQGDRISNATWMMTSGGTGNGTWDALRTQ
ncbi:MAG TPA: hypothetical protein VL326_21380 [Kofleriaceae bacterium]|jgi:hypothetical protein|nr:hypothetical protein [Kofleriaceae bacterium]